LSEADKYLKIVSHPDLRKHYEDMERAGDKKGGSQNK